MLKLDGQFHEFCDKHNMWSLHSIVNGVRCVCSAETADVVTIAANAVVCLSGSQLVAMAAGVRDRLGRGDLLGVLKWFLVFGGDERKETAIAELALMAEAYSVSSLMAAPFTMAMESGKKLWGTGPRVGVDWALGESKSLPIETETGSV